MDLEGLPWVNLDGPSVVSCAAALQLIEENIPYLVRAQRLAAIGAALPARPDVSPLSPSGLRALLKHPLVGGDIVRSQEDPYDDVYVEEVVFHGGPRRVLQGLTSRSAHILQMLLAAIFSPASSGLPRSYVQQARPLVEAVLTLSDTIAVAAGLRRGTAPPQVRRREPFVPGRERLTELRSVVTFTSAELAALLPEGSLEVLNGWIVEAGAHSVTMDRGTDDGLILTPFLRHGADLIVANPGELASALRHHLIVLALDYGCRDALAEVFRQVVATRVGDLLDVLGAVPLYPAAPASDSLLIRQRFTGAANTIIDVGVLTDDLSGYDRAEPFGRWDTPNLGERLQETLDPPGNADEEDRLTLRLAVSDGVGRYAVIALQAPRRPGPMLRLALDELQVMIDLDGSDPLFLWRFAQANQRLHETAQVMEFSKLDLYTTYRDHEYSFYLDDERPPTVLAVQPGNGAALRLQAQRRHDRHYILAPDGRRYVEVMAVFGLDTAPIYFAHPRHGLRAFVVELEDATVWVLTGAEDIEPTRAFVHDVLVAVAYWIWQLGRYMPEVLPAAADAGRVLVTVTLDDLSRWSSLLTGEPQQQEGPDQEETASSGSIPSSSGPWITARPLRSRVPDLAHDHGSRFGSSR